MTVEQHSGHDDLKYLPMNEEHMREDKSWICKRGAETRAGAHSCQSLKLRLTLCEQGDRFWN
jgi:hypothetical protein